MKKKPYLWFYQDPDEFREWKFLNSLSTADLKTFDAKVKEKIERFGNIYFYRPIPKLLPFHEDTNDTRLIHGNNGSGKSIAAAADTGYEFIGFSPYRDVPAPDFGSRLIWIITTDYKIQTDSSQLILFSNVASPVRDIGLLPSIDFLEDAGFEVSWENKQKNILGGLLNPWDGTQLQFKSMEQRTQSLAAAPVDFAWGDEIIPYEKYDEIQARLMRKHGRFIMSYLIDKPEDSWTVTELYRQYQADIKTDGVSTLSFFFVSIEDNTYLDQEDIAKRKKKYTEEGRTWRFSEGGQFVICPRGQVVYEDFVPEHHIRLGLWKTFDPLSTLFRVWDLGAKNPCCTGFQIDELNRKRILFTILGENIELRNFIDQVEAKCKDLFPMCMSTFEVLPHDANRRPANGVSAERATDTFRSKGLTEFRVLYVNVEPSIQSANAALGNWIKRQPEILIDADEAMLMQNMMSLYVRDDKGAPKKDGYFEHISDNFKLMITFCKKLTQPSEQGKQEQEWKEWEKKLLRKYGREDLFRNNYQSPDYGEYD